MRLREKKLAVWPRARRGAIVVLVAVMIPVLLLLSAVAINVAYVEMTREELRVACDSAAKASLVHLGKTQDQTASRAFGRTISNQNLVAGQALNLPDSSFEFGNAVANGSGVYVFTPNSNPLNSARITGTASQPLLINSLLPITTFSTTKQSLTVRASHDIVLVLDRSASMAFDMSSNEFVYPADRKSGTTVQSYFMTPSPTASRWKALSDAVATFVSVLQSRNLDAHVAVVTYAENYTFGTYSSTQASLDVQLTSNYSQATSAMTTWNNTALLGNTNIEAGLTLAQNELTSVRARRTADRTVILLTDGVATSGNTNIPQLAGNLCTNAQTVVDTIAFGGQAGYGAPYTAMVGAAQAGNGTFYNAPTAAQLQQAFALIADSLPAVLVK